MAPFDALLLCPGDIFSICLMDLELLQSKRKPFVFASVIFPSLISEVMMKCPLLLPGQHVAIATDHYIKFIKSAPCYAKVADGEYVSKVLSFFP